jgi:hypothetical protein
MNKDQQQENKTTWHKDRYDDGLQKVAKGFADQNGMKKFWSC